MCLKFRQKSGLIDFLERCDEYVHKFVYSKVKDSAFPNSAVHPKYKSEFTLRYEKTLLKYGEKEMYKKQVIIGYFEIF